MAIQSERVEIPTSGSAGGSMGAYLARPDGGESLPAVIVYMEIFGINSHIRDVVDRVAQEGYVAIAPDYFHRTGPGIELDYDDAGMAEGMGHLGQLKADQMIADAGATIDYLKSRSDVEGGQVACMGFCIGGHMAYLTACETDVKACASYYGGGIAAPAGPGGGASTASRTAGIKGKINCYFGADDAMIPLSQVDAIRSALKEAGVDHRVELYQGTDHGFNCDQRESYNESSAKDAWTKTFTLFNNALKT